MEFLLKFLIYIAFTFFIVFLIALFFLAIWAVAITAMAVIIFTGFGIYFLIKKISK